MKIIIGLGNPGKKYQKTLHNVGFMVVDEIAAALGVKFKTKECLAETATAYLEGERLLLVKPQTYMNLSGDSVNEIICKYKAELEDIIVVYDDFDIERGAIRIRAFGSGGTHNGMKSIISSLKSDRFPRIRVGIGKPENPFIPVADYVLSEISSAQNQVFNQAVLKARDAALMFGQDKPLDAIMQKFNGCAE